MKKSFSLYILLLFLFTGCFSNKHIHLTKGLAAYYPFNGNANDSSKNKNNPVFNNATLTSDRFGKVNSAYHFNGIDQYIQIPNNRSLNSGHHITVCAWVKPTGYYTGLCSGNMMVGKLHKDFAPGNYSLRYADYVTGCAGKADTTKEQFFQNVGAFLHTDQWYHLIYICDGPMQYIYVNSILEYSGASSEGRNFTNDDDLIMGKLNSDAFPYWLNGDLDEVRIYTRAINSKEVKKIFEIQ